MASEDQGSLVDGDAVFARLMTPRVNKRRYSKDDGGFTLVELLISLAILPIIVGSIAVALTSLLSNQNSVTHRVTDTADAQAVSSYYEQDVQSASALTLDASATQCGTGTQLLGLEWDLSTSGSYEDVVSYNSVKGGSSQILVRDVCTSGASTTPTSAFTVSTDIAPSLTSPSITCSSTSATCATSAAAGYIAASNVESVSWSITEPLSNYTYTLVSDPRAGLLPSATSAVATPNSSCGFATPGTGTYASTLCFVDFSQYNPSGTPVGCGGNSKASPIVSAVTNTPYVLSFCITQSGTGPVDPSIIPTYFDPPESEAFLGNNGFYTGIPGKPALYQSTEGTTTTITITNISLQDSAGDVASGWDLVTGDAESTDSGESITWTSDQILSLLPNSPGDQIGNACAAPTITNPIAVDLTGVGTTTVQCSATVDSDKTGTVMLDAPAPIQLSTVLVGTGLEAIFVGVLLP